MMIVLRLSLVCQFLDCTCGFLTLYGNVVNVVSRRSSLQMLDRFMIDKLDSVKRNFESINNQLMDPELQSDRSLLVSLSKESATLGATVEAYDKWRHITSELAIVRENLSDQSDIELKELWSEEAKRFETELSALESLLKVKILPKDKSDDRNVVLEIRAGTGGDEAAIFAGELVNIYKKYCDSQKWSTSCLSESLAEGVTGVKSCILQITGSQVYSKLKYEVSQLCPESCQLMS